MGNLQNAEKHKEENKLPVTLPLLDTFFSNFLPLPILSLLFLLYLLMFLSSYFLKMQLELILANCIHVVIYFLTNRNSAVTEISVEKS